MNESLDWIIFYDDGSTFTSQDGSWEEAPAWKVQIVLYRYNNNGLPDWGIRHGGDYFRLDEDGTVVAMDLIGMIQYVSPWVKVGSMLSPEQFNRLKEAAKRVRLHLQQALKSEGGDR